MMMGASVTGQLSLKQTGADFVSMEMIVVAMKQVGTTVWFR